MALCSTKLNRDSNMWSQGEAGAIAAIASELSKDSRLRIGIGSRLFPAEQLQHLTRATSVSTLPVSETSGNREVMIESKALQSKLSGLDMIIESPDRMIGVELKLSRVRGKLLSSLV